MDYDVVIIGASIAGLECAKHLHGSTLTVLVLEKKKEISYKVCAGGITPEDLNYIPTRFSNGELKQLWLKKSNTEIPFPKAKGVISSIDRVGFLKSREKKLSNSKNVQIRFGVNIRTISNSELILTDNSKINFKYLIGADGSNSIVRRYLKIPTKKRLLALQCNIPVVKSRFEFKFDDYKLGNGYFWVFPHKNFTSFGCCSDIKKIKAVKLRKNFENYMREFGLKTSGIEAATINYDYRGYKFENIFLIGDAAGLASGITGKGICAALMSGEQVANEVMGVRTEDNLIEKWLKKKRAQEKFMAFINSPLLRKVSYYLGLKSLKLPFIEKKVLETL